MTVTHLQNPEHFQAHYRRLYAAAERRGVAIALGGRGLSESLRASLPYTTYGDGLSQLAAFARTLYRHPGRPKRGRPVGSVHRSPIEPNLNSSALPGPSDPRG